MSMHGALGADGLQVVAFGDSLLDAGTYSPFAEATFGGGRFTTNPGRNFTQDVARHYGDRLTPAFVGGFGRPLHPADGLDYAQGGSRVKLQPGIGHAAAETPNADFAEETTIPVQDQVNTYLSTHNWTFNSRQLVLINGGANDLLIQLGGAQAAGTLAALQLAEGAIAQSATDLASVVGTIIQKGATHVAVVNLPDIGKTPLGVTSSDHGQTLTSLSQLFNTTLTAALKQFREKVILIDAFDFLDDKIANYDRLGFTVSNTGFACKLSEQVAIAGGLNLPLYQTDPLIFAQSLFCSPITYSTGADYSYIFADMVHPTTHTNALFAQFVEYQIATKRWDFSDPAMSAQR
jgi:phospholipase/lecithinase/hemolysin